MATLDEIVANKEQYPDDITIDVKGVQFRLGDLRGGYMKDADYRKKTTELATSRKQFEQSRLGFEQEREAAKAELDQIARGIFEKAIQHGGTRTEAIQDVEDDPKIKALNDKIDALNKGIETITTNFKAVKDRLDSGERAFMADQHRRALMVIKQHDPEVDTDELVRYAHENHVARLDLAYRLYTEEARMKKAVEQAKKEGEKVGKETALMDSQPTIPSARRFFRRDDADDKQPKNWDEAVGAASKDPEIVKLVVGEGV